MHAPETHLHSERTAENHEVWRVLFSKVASILPDRICPLYLRGLAETGMCAEYLPDFGDLNVRLMMKTGWALDPVPQYGDDERVFPGFTRRMFPAIHEIRPMRSIDRAESPDIFHDLVGHVPFLMDPAYAEMMRRFGIASINAFNRNCFVHLKLLYVNTVEFGLLQTPQGLRGLGAALASSPEEIVHALGSTKPLRLRFDPLRAMRTDFHFSDLQETYFVLQSLEELYYLLRQDLTPYYKKVAGLPLLQPGERLPSDRLYGS